jgi:hypothetical protein
MLRILFELCLAIGLTLGTILTLVTGTHANELTVSGAFARASATPQAKSGAAYVSILNTGAEADRLLSISTPAAANAVLHATAMAGGVMKMESEDNADVAAGGMLEMRPGGTHVMLTGLSAPLIQGETMELTLHFEKAGDVLVTVPIAGVAANGP